MMKFVDAVNISGTRIRDDGYLVADARVARSGIQLYAGWEVGKNDKEVVRVYRPPEEVFSKDALMSFAHRPVTNDHPDVAVTADNWKDYAVGNTADEVARDGDLLRVPLMVADASAIKNIQNGKRELSAGYSAELDWSDGVTPDGEPYDAIQRNIRANHIAIVDRGRAGSKVRIGDDSNWKKNAIGAIKDGKEVIPMDVIKVTVDGLTIETTEQGKQVIDKLTKQLSDSTALVGTKDAEIAAKDAELAKKDAELAKKDAELAKLDDAALDARVAVRSELIASAKAIAPDVETKGLSDAAIRKAVVVAKLGDAAVKDKSDAYINGRFDAFCEDAAGETETNNAIRTAHSKVDNKDARGKMNDAHAEAIADLNAWRNKSA